LSGGPSPPLPTLGLLRSRRIRSTPRRLTNYPNRLVPMTDTLDSTRRHPFTHSIIRVSLLDKGKGFNRDRYDNMTDSDEHMDLYTTHMSLYTLNNAVLCQVYPTSLKGVALSWFTKLSPNSVDSFET